MSLLSLGGAVGSRVPLRAAVDRKQKYGLAGAERVRWLRFRGSRSEAWAIGADRQGAEICALHESLATEPSSPAGTGAYVEP